MKKYIIKWVIILTVFLAALFVISSIMNKGNTDMTVEMSEASFPVVTMKYGGRAINELHGYDDTMEVNYMRESITPLAAGRKVSLQIDCYGREISGIDFEVRSIDGQRLVENTKVQEFTVEEDVISVSFGLKDLIDSEKEYVLVLILTMDDGAEIRYYTRVVYSENYYANEKLDYIVDFSNRTFDKEQAKELTKYLESNSEGDNTTLGKVTIHSSFNQVTWGDLKVTKEGATKITIKELASQTGSFLLQYFVSAKEGKKTNYYTVSEFYRVRYTAERMYLLDYERTMNQIFDETEDVFNNNKIYLGITGDEVPLEESDGGNVIAFVTGNRLYSYNVVDHKLAYLFGFYNKENSDARTLYNKYRVKILNVDEGGNVTFMVYGYMNRGRHEGKVGISVYYYDSTVNTTEEMVYVPYSKSPELLLAEVEQLAYINRMGTLYLMLDNEIYGISAMNRSCEVVSEDLKEGCYKVSDSNRMVVWQKENQLYQGTELILMNLNTGKQSSIKAGSGEVIAPVGFMGDDLIYGIAKKSDIVPDHTGSVIFPMYCIRIQNEAEGVLKEYRQENVYVIEGSVAGNQITLKRVRKNEDGEYEDIPDDQILNAEVADDSLNTVETVAIDIYEKVTQIALKNEIQKASIKFLTPKEVLFEGGRNIVVTKTETGLGRYYVYGKNGIEGIFMDEGNAVSLASGVSGVVVDDAGAYVWMKGNRSLKNQIMAIQGEAATEEKGALAVCLDTILTFEGISRNSQYLLDRGENVFTILENNLEDATVLDLSGCSLDSVLYYVNQDIPVLVMLEDGSAVLLIGFNEMNTVIMNPETGTVYKMGMNDSKEWFEQNGNRFITYIKAGQ
ncbi:MAG: hypothetical protein J6C64_13235 [Lachnospiraceae bacterium]|nr:hypothetical protein [Lachnospiraceae bacterium]